MEQKSEWNGMDYSRSQEPHCAGTTTLIDLPPEYTDNNADTQGHAAQFLNWCSFQAAGTYMQLYINKASFDNNITFKYMLESMKMQEFIWWGGNLTFFSMSSCWALLSLTHTHSSHFSVIQMYFSGLVLYNSKSNRCWWWKARLRNAKEQKPFIHHLSRES